MSRDELDQITTAAVDLRTAAQAFGIPQSTAYKLARDGEFPVRTIRVGRSYVVPVAEIRTALGINDSSPAVDDAELLARMDTLVALATEEVRLLGIIAAYTAPTVIDVRRPA